MHREKWNSVVSSGSSSPPVPPSSSVSMSRTQNTPVGSPSGKTSSKTTLSENIFLDAMSNENDILYNNAIHMLQWLTCLSIIDSSHMSITLPKNPSSSSPRLVEIYRTFTKVPPPIYPPNVCIPPSSISKYFTYIHTQASSPTLTTILPRRRLANELLPPLWRYLCLLFSLARLPSSHQTPLYAAMDGFLPILLYSAVLPYPDIIPSPTLISNTTSAVNSSQEAPSQVYVATGVSYPAITASSPATALRAEVKKGIVAITPAQRAVSMAEYIAVVNTVLSVRRLAMCVIVLLCCPPNNEDMAPVTSLFEAQSGLLSGNYGETYPINRVFEVGRTMLSHPTLWRQYKYDFFRVLLQAEQDRQHLPSDITQLLYPWKPLHTAPFSSTSTESKSNYNTVTWDSTLEFCERLAWASLPLGTQSYQYLWVRLSNVWRRDLERFASDLNGCVVDDATLYLDKSDDVPVPVMPE